MSGSVLAQLQDITLSGPIHHHNHRNQQTPLTHIAPRLLTLPREIRDLIYHELWLHAPDIRLHDQSHCRPIEMTYELDFCGPIQGLPEWLLTSKVILQEGLEQLYRVALWTIQKTIPANHPYSKPNPLAGLAAATNLCLRDSYRRHEDARSLRLNAIAIRYSKHPYGSLLALTPNLKKLSLTLSIKLPADHSITLDFSELIPQMLRLDQLTVTFLWNLWAATGEECLQSHESFFDMAKAELSRVGKFWVGDGADVQVEDKLLLTRFYSAEMRDTSGTEMIMYKYMIQFTIQAGGTN